MHPISILELRLIHKEAGHNHRVDYFAHRPSLQGRQRQIGAVGRPLNMQGGVDLIVTWEQASP